MRKRAAMALCIILALSAIPSMQSVFAGEEEDSIVRVKLSVGTTTALSFYVDGNYIAGDSTAAIERDQYTVKLENGSLNMYCGSRKICGGASIKLIRHEATGGRNNFIWLYNTHYKTSLKYIGDMEFLINGSSIEVINHIYIEDYLCGVVPYEMSDSYPIEALKAQAIAARNYAAKRMGSPDNYDLTDDSSNDQVYKGYSPSAINAAAAVNDTAGQVLTYGDAIIDCYYSASNGGWTELPYHRWGGGATWPYYRIDRDPYDTYNPYDPGSIGNQSSRYEMISFPVTIDAAHVVTTAQSPSLTGTIDADKAIEYIHQAIYANPTAQAQLAACGVTDANGFDLTGVTSFSTHTYDTGNDQDHSRMPLSGVNECVDMVMAKSSFTVSVDETSIAVADIDLDLRELKSNGSYPAFFAADLGVFIVDTVYDEVGTPTAFNLSMKRYGHGCGLSQRGAEQRAKSIEKGGGGQTYQEILQFYYPGTAIAKQAYTRPALTAVSTPDHTNASVRLTDSTPLNVRTGPGTSFGKLGNLPDNARIEVVQASAAAGNGYTWHKILFAGQYAYVVVNYVQLDDPQPTPEACTVKFVSNSGSAVPDWTGRHGDNIAAAPSVLRTGYSFGGWYTNSSLTAPASFPYIVTHDTSLYAKWNTAPFTITYNLNGGTASNPSSYTANDTITLNTPTRSGYIFSGWTETGLSAVSASVTIPKGSAGNRAYTANWKAQVKSAYLARISLSAGSLNKSFSKTSYSYKIKLGENQSSVTLTPVKEYSGATMKIAGKSVSNYTVSLSNGKSTTVSVKVKYGKTSKTYKFTVTRAKSTNNNLATLTASAGTFDKSFNASVTSYTLTLDENTKSTTIKDTVVTSLAKATFKSKKVTLSNGQTKVVKLTVKAQSGAKKTYTIKVTRAKSTNTGLKYLKTNSKSYPLSPAYSAGTTNYTITLPVNKSSVTISAKALGYKAAVYFDGAKKSSGKVTLSHGQSVTVHISVKAQAGNTKDYYVAVTRL